MFIFSLAAARGWLHWDSMSPSPMHITQHCCPHIPSSLTPSPPLKKSDKIKYNWPDQHWLVFSHIRVYEKEPSCVASEHNTPPPLHPAPHPPPHPPPPPGGRVGEGGGGGEAAVYHIALCGFFTLRAAVRRWGETAPGCRPNWLLSMPR